MGNTSKRYSPEVQERAVRLFREHVHEYPSRWAAVQSIAGKIGCTANTLRNRVLRLRRRLEQAVRDRLGEGERDIPSGVATMDEEDHENAL